MSVLWGVSLNMYTPIWAILKYTHTQWYCARARVCARAVSLCVLARARYLCAVCMCVHVRSRVHACMHACVLLGIDARECACLCVCTCVLMCVFVCVCAIGCVFVHARVRVLLCACLCICLVCACACLRVGRPGVDFFTAGLHTVQAPHGARYECLCV